MKFGSVCSGIEAASAAWDVLGWSASWFAEIEPFPSSVLAHRYPDVPNLGDMTKIAAQVRAGTVEAPDILVGGTPCQAFSVAGARAGLLDPRGQLTLSYADLLNAIDERRPGNECIAIWENVPGVLSDSTNAFGCFLGILAGEDEPLQPAGKGWSNAGTVYGPQRTIAWRVLNAEYFGVAQRRRRVFVIASARKDFNPATVLFESDSVRRDTAPRRETGQDVAGTVTGGASMGGMGPGRSHYLNAGGMGRQDYETETMIAVAVCPTLRAGGNSTGGDRPPGTDVDTCDSLIVSPTLRGTDRRGASPRSGPDRREDANGVPVIAHALRAVAFDSRQDCVSSMERFGALGSSSPQAQAVAFAENSRGELRLEAGDGSRTGTLSTGGGKPGQGTPTIAQGWQVRRLTPTECERLQGFPDGWTQVPHRNKPAADGPRYKSLGNSMCVFNMRWLGIRIILTHSSLIYPTGNHA